MGVVSPKTTADRFLHALTGVIPDLEGDVTLEPSNHFINWKFDDLDEDGNPDGLEIGRPEDPDGFMVYVSDRNGGPSTLTAQTTEEIDLDEDSFHIIADPVDGAAPRSSQFAAQIDQPDPPTLSVVAASNQGWAAGTYLVSYTWIDEEDRHTALAPTVRVTLGLGQFLRVFLPTSVADGATHIGIWVTSPNGGVDTLRLQAFYSISLDFPESVLLKGPYTVAHAGVSPPSSNDTKSKKPKKPKGRKKKLKGGKGKKGKHRARIRKRNRRNGRSSEASDWSDPVDISEEEANAGIGFDVETGQSGSYDVFVERDGKEMRMADTKSGRKNSKKPHKKKKKKKKKGGKGKKNHHTTNGKSVNEGGNLSSGGGGGGGSAGGSSTPQDDGVQDPTSPLDSALPEGQIIISPGAYWVALSYTVRGEETMISNPTQITITSGQTIRVSFPDKNNLLTNAQFRDLNANGYPDSWAIEGVAAGEGTVSISPESMVTLDTFGAKTGTTKAPVMHQWVSVSRNQYYAIGGRISASLISGSFEVVVDEATSTSGAALRSTTLISLPSTGFNMDFMRVFGAGYFEFHPDTTWIKLRITFAGSTRNGVGFIHELFVNPNTAVRLRRFNEPKVEGEFVESDPAEYVRWNKSSIVGVGLPPTVGGNTLGAPLAALDFETTDLGGFTLQQAGATTGLAAVRETAAAISGSFGYRLQKSTNSEAWNYLARDMGASRTDLAHNFRVRIQQRPSTGAIALGGIKNDSLTGAGSGMLAGVFLTYQGTLHVGSFDGSTLLWYTIASGIVDGDVLDIEVRAQDTNSNGGKLRVSMGKNGSSRIDLHRTIAWHWSGKFARWALVGQFSYSTPTGFTQDASVLYNLNYDDIVETTSGNFGALSASIPEGFAYPLADRPTKETSEIESISFDGGSLPTGYTAVRTPTDSTTAVAVETAANIDGAYGVRCTDTNTTVTATAYVRRTLSSVRTGLGFRSRHRIVSLPSTGSTYLKAITATNGSWLAAVRIENTGNLYAESYTSAGALFKSTKVMSGITANTIVTLEMVASGGLSDAGELSVWAARGGTGATAERNLMARHQLIPWTTRDIKFLDAGIVSSTAALNTITLHLDSIRLTEAGEIILSELDTQGNNLYQAYFYYPQGTPQRDDLGLKGLEIAVQPNETYTVSLQARHSDVPVTEPAAFPYSLFCYDQNGTEYAMGSLYGEGGAVGSMPWTDLSQTITIPNGCYLLTMSSPGISSGEFVAQELAISRGVEATREVIYPESGQVWVILDTETPHALHPLHPTPLNPWLNIGAVVDTPEGTSASVQYNSADPVYDDAGNLVFTGTEQPTSWITDPLTVKPRKYLHVLVGLNASSDLRSTPTLATETPYCDFYTRIAAEQVNVLLRDDLSEFNGGVYLSNLGGYRELSEFDVRSPLGQVRRHRMWDPIGDLGGFTMHAYTLDAVRDIEENCLSEDFAIETRDYRLTVRFREQLEFDVEHGSSKKVQGVWTCLASATTSGVEVVEVHEINKLLDVWVPTQAEMV